MVDASILVFEITDAEVVKAAARPPHSKVRTG
jgi:hypothetical protein